MKSIAQIILILLVIVITTIAIQAQVPGLPQAPNQAPIDGGLSLLAVAGGAYAIKKLRDKN